MSKYLTGYVTYDTHKQAEIAFSLLPSELALSNDVHINLMKDGTATINYLRDKPMYEGQAEYTAK